MGNFIGIDSPLIRILNRMADLMWLNILTIICCIPIITAGASITSMYYVTLKMVKEEDCYITKSFFKAFKENFRQSTIIGIIMLVIGGSIFMDFYLTQAGYFEMSQISRILLLVVAVIYYIIFVYIFAVQARYENKILHTFSNTVLLAISNFPKTILLLFINSFLIVCVYLSDWALLVMILLGFSLTAFSASFILRNIFEKLENKEQKEEE